MPPCAVISHQSPWHHTFGNLSKYAARYLAPSGSFQKPSGMAGKGLVHTSSPFSFSTETPFSLKTSTAIPSPLAWISPRHTGPAGLPSTKHDTMSVPPEIEETHTSSLMFA